MNKFCLILFGFVLALNFTSVEAHNSKRNPIDMNYTAHGVYDCTRACIIYLMREESFVADGVTYTDHQFHACNFKSTKKRCLAGKVGAGRATFHMATTDSDEIGRFEWVWGENVKEVIDLKPRKEKKS